jgi:hypothetical protein
MRLIELDRATIERCVVRGREIVRAHENRDYPQSTALSSHGAEKDPQLQAVAVMAECILAVHLNLSVERVFEAPPLRPWDILFGGQRIDVKQTGLHGRYLIWPKNKNGIYLSKDFDLLTLVKNDWNVGHPQGWIGKQDFYRHKSIAGAGHKLDPGTWHLDQSVLKPIESLPGLISPDDEFEAFFAKRPMSRAELKARAWVESAPRPAPMIEAPPPSPVVQGWRRAFRYDYAEPPA